MKTVFLFISLIVGQFLIAQSNSEWALFNSVNGVNFYMITSDCSPENIPNQKGVLIKIVNSNSFKVKISWEVSIWYDGKEHKANIRDGENEYEIELNPNKSVSGSCEQPNGALYIFKEFTTFSNGAKMTKFEFNTITVIKE